MKDLTKSLKASKIKNDNYFKKDNTGNLTDLQVYIPITNKAAGVVKAVLIQTDDQTKTAIIVVINDDEIRPPKKRKETLKIRLSETIQANLGNQNKLQIFTYIDDLSDNDDSYIEIFTAFLTNNEIDDYSAEEIENAIQSIAKVLIHKPKKIGGGIGIPLAP